MTLEQVISFAESNEFDGVEYLDKWRGYDVYAPTFNGEETRIVGGPFHILVKGNEIRMSTTEESFQHIDEMEVDEDEEA